MIFFKKIRWKNFLSTGNVFTELDLSKSKTTLIVGENGAGKSTILDALTFVLFGKPFRKINKPQLANSITKKDTVVEVEFQVGQHTYVIIRGMKPNIFEVYHNGMLVNQSAEMKDYQEYLEKNILKLNYKSFCQVVVLGSASFVPFMQLAAGQRREIIEDLLDLQIFTKMNSILKDKIQLNNEQVYDIESDQKVIMARIKLIKEHLLEKQNMNELVVAEKVSLIDETNANIETLNTTYWGVQQQIEAQQESLEDEAKISKRVKQLTELRHKIEAKRSIINNDLEFFAHHDGCPTCKQIIDSTFKEKTVAEKQKELEEISDALDQLMKQYEEANERLNDILNVHSSINLLQMQQIKTKSNIDSMIKYRDQLEKEINNINIQHEAEEDDKMASLEAELNDVAKRYNDAMDQKQMYAVASVLLRDGGIKSRIIKQYVPVINKLINKYLSSLDFFVQFELDEEFNETIRSRFRDEFSYASFSEGEKMRINLAILFTWRAVAKLRNSVSTNLLIMDEVFDSSLDSAGTEEFLKILQQLTQDTNTFIISHKTDQLYDKFETVLKFEKKQNFSRLAS